MERKQKNLGQKVLGIIMQLFKSLKKIFREEKSELKPQKKSATTTSENRELMQSELHYKAGELHYLLDATATWLDEGKRQNTRETSASLVRKWEYMLGATDCKELAAKFSTLKNSSHTAEELVQNWLKFLSSIGLKQIAAQDDEITLTTENRGLFENGRLYGDGKRFLINKHAWFLNGELLIRGELYEGDES